MRIRARMNVILGITLGVTAILLCANVYFVGILGTMQNQVIAIGQHEQLANDSQAVGDRLYSVWADAIINRSMDENAKEWDEQYAAAKQLMDQVKAISATDAMSALHDKAAQALQQFDDTYRNQLLPLVSATKQVTPQMIALDDDVDALRNSARDAMIQFDGLLKDQLKAADQEFDAQVFVNTLVSVIVALLGIVVIFAVSLSLGRSISTPLKTQVSILGDLAQGEGDLTLRLDDRRKDELGELGRRFNAFLEKLGDILSLIRTKMRVVDQSSRTLAENTNEGVESLTQIQQKVELLMRSLVEQGASITETSASVEEINKNVSSFLDNVDRQRVEVENTTAGISKSAEQLSQLDSRVHEANAKYGTLAQQSKEGRAKITAVVDLVREVGRQSESLVETNKVVSSIAAQTSLLAMNAAIEAAHAGEAGRGFAVVADEIRKLSESSSLQAKAIASSLKGIKSQIDQVQQSSQEAGEVFNLLADQIATSAGLQEQIATALETQLEANRKTIEAFDVIKAMSQEIQMGSEEMKIGSQSIQDEMTRLVSQSTQAREAVTEVSAQTSSIQAVVERISGLAQENTVAVGLVEEQTNRFKLE